MKKILKSRMFFFILGALIFGGIGAAFAYSLNATDVGFDPTDTTWLARDANTALNNLRNRTNALNTFSLGMKAENNDSRIVSAGTITFSSQITKNYRYFTVSTLRTFGSNAECSLHIYSAAQDKFLNGTVNTEYFVNSSTDGYKWQAVQLYDRSSSYGVWSSCEATVTFYN